VSVIEERRVRLQAAVARTQPVPCLCGRQCRYRARLTGKEFVGDVKTVNTEGQIYEA